MTEVMIHPQLIDLVYNGSENHQDSLCLRKKSKVLLFKGINDHTQPNECTN